MQLYVSRHNTTHLLVHEKYYKRVMSSNVSQCQMLQQARVSQLAPIKYYMKFQLERNAKSQEMSTGRCQYLPICHTGCGPNIPVMFPQQSVGR